MSQTNISMWLKFALQQMTAESYLDQLLLGRPLREILLDGNNDTRFVQADADGNLPGKTRFTNVLADRFLATYDILDHHANDATGFSATLMRDRTTGEYTLSFRSTDYRNQAEGGDYERDGANGLFLTGADGEIFTKGFAFGQLAAMEHYYQTTVKPVLPAGAVLNVTGYSLGAHLATVFTELHGLETNTGITFGHTYTFNGPGRGELSGGQQPETVEADRMRAMITRLTEVLTNPMAGIEAGTPEELWPPSLHAAVSAWQQDPTWDPWASGSTRSVYTDARYLWAKQVVEEEFAPVSRSLSDSPRTDGAFSLITQLVGHATHGDTEYVANSGHHAVETRVYIEDQPDLDGFGGFLGASGDFGTTHSLTLIVDSLATQELFQTLAPTLTQSDIEAIFAASSNQLASGFVGAPGVAEGNSLENALDALGKLFVPNYTSTQFGRQTGDFGSLAFRNPFYANLAAVKTALAGGTVAIEPFVEMGVVDGQPTALPRLTPNEVISEAQQNTDRGLAFRYALLALNPFAVIGADYTGLGHTADGQLALFDPVTGFGEMTAQYLTDRAAFLEAKIELGLLNQEKSTDTIHFRDVASNYEIQTTALFEIDNRQFLFGGEESDALQGEGLDDHLYGGDGHDVLLGQGGADYLEGGAGNDILAGGAGDDDLLVGGAGFDTYIYNSGEGTDRIEDAYGQNAILFDQRLLQGGVHRNGDPANTYTSLDGQFTYVKSGGDLIVNGVLTLNENFQNGQFGIRLVDLPAFGAATRTEFLKVDHYEQVGTNPDGTPIVEPVYAPFFDDAGNDSRSSALTSPIGDDHNLIHALGGNDTVISGAGDDQLYGDDGDDWLAGFGGHDRIYGGAGNDTINGDDSFTPVMGNDYLDGGDGDDLLQGSAGADVILGGAGNDNLNGDDAQAEAQGTYGTDLLYGGDGDDELHGGGGADVLIGGTGNDLLIGDTTLFQGGSPEIGAADTLDGGPGDDQLFGLYGDDVLSGGLDNDLVNGQDGNDVLYGGDGNDTLSGDLRVRPADGLYDSAEHRGAGGNDLLEGGAGIDVLYGGEGDDVLRGGADSDTLYGDYNPNLFPVSTYTEIAGANDTLNGSALVWGNDVLDGGDGNDTLYGGDGDDRLSGGTGDDGLLGGDGVDHLFGDDGRDNLDGGFGDDELHGGAGNDRLFAGQGNDTLYGDEGDDDLNSGNEYFESGNSVLLGGAGNDSYVIDGLGDQVIEEAASGTDTVESFISYTLPDHVEHFRATASGLVGTGNALDNEMRGNGSTTLDGRAGNDTLIDGRTYVFGHGYGVDTIVEHDPSNAPYFPGGIGDAVQFAADVLPSHVRWQRSGDDVILSLDGTTDQLLIPSFYTVALNQGTYLFSSNIFLPGATVTAGGNPYYVAPSQVEQFQFADGTIWGPEAFDAPMLGASQANTYRFGRGSGQDTIIDFDVTSEQATDLIEMGADALPSDLTVSRVGDNLVLSLTGTSDRLTVQSHFASVFVRPSFSFSGITVPAYRIEQVQFANGAVWDAATLASQIREFTGTEAADFLLGNQLDNTILGLGGDDTLHGQEGDDLLDGGAGDDTLFGGTGADTYVFGRGSGHDTVYDDNFSSAEIDTIRLAADVTPGDVTLQADQERGLVLGVTGTTDQLTLRFFLDGPFYEIEQMVFADGTTWDTAAMLAQATGRSLTGTEEADGLSGTVLSDVLEGLGGDDFLDGREGDDTLRGGAGQDELAGRAGADLLEGAAGNDTYYFNPGDGIDTIADTAAPGEGNRIVFGEGIAQADLSLAQSQNVLTIQVGTGGDAIQLMNFDPTGTNGSLVVETLVFADGREVPLAGLLGPTITEGDDVIVTGTGDQVIDALGGHDTVDAGAGNDTLMGGPGNDTLIGGAGHDVLDGGPDSDLLQGGQGDDTFRFSIDGTWPSRFVAKNSGSPGYPGTGQTVNLSGKHRSFDVFSDEAGVDTLLGTAGDDAIALDDAFSPFPGSAGPRVVGIERIEVGDGNDLVDLTSPLYDYGDVSLDGGAGDDVLWAGAGHDRLLGGAGKDHLYGGAGDDRLLGGDGSDTLDGGPGADMLVGGLGNDIYVVDDAGDVVTEAANEGSDTVKSSITYTLGGHVENLTLTGSAAINGTGNALNNVLIGNGGANVLAGGAGNDTLKGGRGDDTYVFGRGDGRDKIVENDATAGNTDTLLFGAGITPLDLMLERHVNDLRMALYGTADQITIQNWYTGAAAQTEVIQAGNGEQLLNTQVEQLIQAMAGFSAQTGLTWEQAIAQRPEDVQAILAANWQ